MFHGGIKRGFAYKSQFPVHSLSCALIVSFLGNQFFVCAVLYYFVINVYILNFCHLCLPCFLHFLPLLHNTVLSNTLNCQWHVAHGELQFVLHPLSFFNVVISLFILLSPLSYFSFYFYSFHVL